MRPTTEQPPTSSRESARAIVLRLEPSRLIPRAWVALHVLLAGAVAATAFPWPVKVALAALVAAHGLRRRPGASPRTLVCRADGRFDLPDLRHEGLALGVGTVFTAAWARLVLVGDARSDVLLAKDQVDESSWRQLLAHLEGGTAGH